MKINNVLCLCLYLCFISCGKYENRATLKYQKELKRFPSYMVDFFPDTLSSVYSIVENIDTTSQCVYYMNYDFKPRSIVKLQKYLAEKSLGNYLASDTSLVIIKTESVIYWDDSKKVYYKKIFKNNTDYYPIPFFEKEEFEGIINSENIYSNVNTSGLSNDFAIYILDSKPGLYWKGLKPNKYMPKGWGNGYSKGVCINERRDIIIYWVIIW
ncbi:hypothetical protein [uncultured Bacteroides sp.]|uniref:hypothetical protein n=1 Tax=uncultured Bacteroides sp. TaxID=162156 RepID=UPI002AA7C9CD|nr:hypothetical protein [uncultured Bacteroides sp.]